MSEMTEVEILDDQTYLSDLRGKLKDIEERREDILHQIKRYENKLQCNRFLNKLQENVTDNQETNDKTHEEKPTDTKNMSAEEIDDRIYLSEREDITQEEIEELIRLKFNSRPRLSAKDEWNNYTIYETQI